jgi:hypothetical protein
MINREIKIMNGSKNILNSLKCFFHLQQSLFSSGSNSNMYLSFLQSFIKPCNSSNFDELVITTGKAVSILDTFCDTILLYLFCRSFSVTLILSRSLVVSASFRERAISFACSSLACLVVLSCSIISVCMS